MLLKRIYNIVESIVIVRVCVMKNTIYIYIYVFIYVNILIDIYLIYLYHCMCFIEMFFKSIFRSISIPSQLERCSKTVYIYIYICTSFYAGLIIFTFDFVHICTIWGYRRLYSCCIWLCGMIIGNDPVPDSQKLVEWCNYLHLIIHYETIWAKGGVESKLTISFLGEM